MDSKDLIKLDCLISRLKKADMELDYLATKNFVILPKKRNWVQKLIFRFLGLEVINDEY